MHAAKCLSVVVFLFVFSLTAGATVAQDAPKITMLLETAYGPEGPDCVQKYVIDAYNATNPEVPVEGVLQANAWDATRVAVAGGAGPDVVGTPGPSFQLEMAKAGFLVALDDYAEQYGWSERFVPWALDLGRTDGTLYSLPSEIETLVLYYNATLFEEKGWEVPKTVDELVTLADAISAEGIIPFGHANAEWRPTNEWFVGEFLNHMAGPQAVYEALTGARSWADPAFVEAMTVLNDLQQKGYFMGGLDRYYTTEFTESHAALGSGEAAMNIEGTWFMLDIANYFGEAAGNANDWGWAPIPSKTGDPIFTLGIGSTYSINANSKYPDATAALLDFLFLPETQAALVVNCNFNPAPVIIAPELLEGLESRHAAVIQALNEASLKGDYGYTTWTFWPPKSEQYLIEQVEVMWAGDITPEEFLQGHQAIFDEELAEGILPPIPARGE